MPNYQEHLRLLVEKHHDQAVLFYKRFELYVVLMTGLVGAIGAIIATASKELNPQVLWFIVAGVCGFGAFLSSVWYRVMRPSAGWIDFWHAKIVYFEAKESKPSHVTEPYHLFLDRKAKEAPHLRPEEHPGLDREGITVTNKRLSSLTAIEGRVPPGRIGKLLVRFPMYMMIFYLIFYWLAVALGLGKVRFAITD